MSKFTVTKKGYSAEEVDAYILRTENTLNGQRERIEQLTAENTTLINELRAFKQKQELIAKAIMSAAEKAEQIESLTKQKYANDMANLNAFHERWLAYYNKLIERYPLDDELMRLNNFNEKMTNILTGQQTVSEKMSAAQSQLNKENERLRDKGYIWLPSSKEQADEEFNPEQSIRALLRRQALEEEQKRKNSPKRKKREDSSADFEDEGACSTANDGFDYDEALNPKQSLSEILQDLGIMLDE